MMNSVNSAFDSAHEAVDRLLPWYVNGTLDADERAAVDAHLASCDRCRAGLADETVLRDNYRDLPVEAAASWSSLRERIAPQREANRKTRVFSAWRRGRGSVAQNDKRPRRLATLFAAQAAVMLFVVVTAGPLMQSINPFGDSYRGLSSTAKPAAGNIVAVFRPDTPERALRETLKQVGATIVDGPTTADAYVLRVAPDRRHEQIVYLRAQPSVVLAEPIDSGDQP